MVQIFQNQEGQCIMSKSLKIIYGHYIKQMCMDQLLNEVKLCTCLWLNFIMPMSESSRIKDKIQKGMKELASTNSYFYPLLFNSYTMCLLVCEILRYFTAWK